MGRGEAYTGFWWGIPRERDHLGDPGVDGIVILRWIFKTWDVVVLIGKKLAKDRGKWRSLVNAVMKV